MKFRVQGPREGKKTIVEALSDAEGHGVSLADRVRELASRGQAAEAVGLIQRKTGMRDDEARRFIDALNA
jgi:hypothetical protein